MREEAGRNATSVARNPEQQRMQQVGDRLYMSTQHQTGIPNIAQGAGSGAMASGMKTAQKIGTEQQKRELLGEFITKQHQEAE